MNSKTEITVVIPSWKGAAFLRRTLPSVLQQRDVNFSVLVVENGIADETAAVVAGFRNVKLLQIQENCGYVGGVNAGVLASPTKLVAVLCNDNEVDPYWLKELFIEFSTPQARPVAAVMSQTAMNGLDSSKRGTLNFLGKNISFIDDEIFRHPVPIFYPGGNAFLFDKSILPLPFDSRFFTYQEDVYLGWRLRNLGYEVLYCHASVAKSFDGGTTRKTPWRSAFLTERNRWLNFLYFLESRTLCKLLPLLFLFQIIGFVSGKNRMAKIVAHLWLLTHAPEWVSKRRLHQAERKVGDEIALQTMSSLLFSTPASSFKTLCNKFLFSYFRIFHLPFKL